MVLGLPQLLGVGGIRPERVDPHRIQRLGITGVEALLPCGGVLGGAEVVGEAGRPAGKDAERQAMRSASSGAYGAAGDAGLPSVG
ncbi:hypothetical protein SSPO_002870 [Streptomyces antimycoticus]|uniref:Uncharacterized protein n=1 Tax=Streptomyces antimycoticus TaxID=68175 RepID=A0A499UKF2_9ACTN|nr:hypothetical protein SSPO_002870 [Streptomyces antimycoticus]